MARMSFSTRRSLTRSRRHGIAEEIAAGVLEVPWAVRVFAVHDFRLHRVQCEAKGPEPLGNGSPQTAGLVLSVAVCDNVVGVALEWAAREFPVHPFSRVAPGIFPPRLPRIRT